MRLEHLRSEALEITSFVLAQASIWWGLVVSIGYEFAFAFVVSRDQHESVGGGLPMFLPVIGIAFGALAALAARWNGQRCRYAILGLALNAVPMALALIIWIAQRLG